MRLRLCLLLGSIWALPLASQVPVLPAPSHIPPKIYLVGSVHDMHFQARYHYSLTDLRTEIKSLHPDVVCGEITPEAFNGPMEGNFPPEAAMLAELAPHWRVRFVPADWRVSFALQEAAEKQEAQDKRQAANVDAEQGKLKAYLDAFPGGSLYDYMNGSAKYQEMVDHMFEDVIGSGTPSDIAAGAWHERNRMIVRNCLNNAGPAKSIVFVFGSAHLAQIKRQLAAIGLEGEIAKRTFSPTGFGTMPHTIVDRWRRNLKNLEGVINGHVTVPADMRAKAQDTNRVPALKGEIAVYSKSSEAGR